MRKCIQIARKLTDGIVVALFSLLCVLVVGQIACRLLHLSQPWIEELARYTFVWVVYLGGAYTVLKGMNIALDLLPEYLQGKAYRVLLIFISLISVIFLLIVAYIGAQNAYINRIQIATMTGLNMGLVNLAIPVGAILMCVAQIEFCLNRLNELKHEEVAQS